MKQSTTGWAECHREVEWIHKHPPGCTPEQIAYRVRRPRQYADRRTHLHALKVYDEQWQQLITLPRLAFNATGNDHNWHNCDRYDITFPHPDGWTWYGRLIVGNWGWGNETFRIRRTKNSQLLKPCMGWWNGNGNCPRIIGELRQSVRHGVNNRCLCRDFKLANPVIEPHHGGYHIKDGNRSAWFAQVIDGHLMFARHWHEMVAHLLTGQLLAA